MSHPVVVDACTVRNFSAVGQLSLLSQILEGNGRWTSAIRSELQSGEEYDASIDISYCEKFLGLDVQFSFDDYEAIFDIRESISDPLSGPRSNMGEAEAIHGLLKHPELQGGSLLSDDRAAIDFAIRRGIRAFTSGAALAYGYTKGYVNCPDAYQILVEMRKAGRGVQVPEDHYSICPPKMAA